MRQKKEKILMYILIITIFLFCFYIMETRYKFSFITCIFMVLSLEISLYITEIGTLIFKLLSGYEFSYIRFYKLLLIKKNGKFYFKIVSPKVLPYITFSVPPAPFNRPKLNFCLQYSGYIANLIFSIFFLFLHLINFGKYYTGMFFWGLTVSNFLFVFLGFILLFINKKNKFDYSMWIYLQIYYQALNGVRYKNMPPEWFSIPQGNNLNNTVEAVNSVFTLNRMIDEFNFKEAGEIGSYILSQSNALSQNIILIIKMELAFIDIIAGTYTTNIHLYIKNNMNHLLNNSSLAPSSYRLLYAYELLVNNNEPAANRYLYYFDNAIKKYPFLGEAETELELISYIHQKHHEKHLTLSLPRS